MSTASIRLIRQLRKKKRIFVHINGNTLMNLDTNTLVFRGRQSSPIIAQRYIGEYCISLVNSGNVFITLQPTIFARKKIVSFKGHKKNYKIKYLIEANTHMCLRSQCLYIYNGTRTSTVVAQKVIDGYCVSITLSGSVYITLPPTIVNL